MERSKLLGFIEAVFIDFDGTLVDSHFVWKEVDEEYQRIHNINITQEYIDNISVMGLEELASYTKEYFNLPTSENEILREWIDMASKEYAGKVHTIKGADEFLKELNKNNIPVHLVTACHPELVKSFFETHHEFSGYFKSIVYVDSCGIKKDNPKFFKNVCAKYGYDMPSVLVVDDICKVLETVSKEGFKCMGVNSGDSDPVAVIEAERIKEKLGIQVIYDYRDAIPFLEEKYFNEA